jgi:hypothetical protein
MRIPAQIGVIEAERDSLIEQLRNAAEVQQQLTEARENERIANEAKEQLQAEMNKQRGASFIKSF